MDRRWLAGCVVAAAVGPAGAQEFTKHRARPGFAPAVPNYDYRPADTRAKTAAAAISLEKVPAAENAAAVLFQLPEARLRVDHCFVSRVAVTVYPDGSFQVAFRADQNPVQSPADALSPLKAGETVEKLTTLQTAQLRRNAFALTVRGTAGAGAAKGAMPAPGVVFDLPVPEFWVQRGEPYYGLVRGRCPEAARGVLLADRVEVSFTYR